MKEIELTRGMVAIVDDEDFEWAKQYHWHLYVSGTSTYAARGRKGKHQVTMHQEIALRAGMECNKFIDHKNGNGLDNCRNNLRSASPAENQRNRNIQSNNTSGYKGVYCSKQAAASRRWRASISTNGKVEVIGYFPTKEEAAEAYDKRAVELFGEFALTNKEIQRRKAAPERKQLYAPARPNRRPVNAKGYRGVSFSKSKKKWVAQISHENRKVHIGYFLTELEAAQAYDKKALELHGANARINFTRKFNLER